MSEDTGQVNEPSRGSRRITDFDGVLHVVEDTEHAVVNVEFDPTLLSDGDVRELLKQHITHVESEIRKSTFRLESNACERCALKLERRVTKIPGVRYASATYLGRVLSVTFDSSAEAGMEQQLKDAGAVIGPLEASPKEHQSICGRLGTGALNEEISCAVGLMFLIAAFLVQKFSGTGLLSHVLYGGVYLFAGQQGVRSAWASLREKELDIDVLMVLAAIGAAAIGAPFEGGLLLFLFSFSNVLQRHAMDRTSKAIESLLTMRPTEALVKRGGKVCKVPVEGLDIGDVVVVKPGEQIPVDGELVEGRTCVDESSLTGESMPVEKSGGSALFAGTINQTGGIEMRVTKRSGDSTLARMVKLVAEAQAEKSGTQRFLETAEQYYAMGVIGVTVLVMLVPWMMGWQEFGAAFYRAMTVMVVASPCALVISTPATVLSAIGGAARKGILIKGGSHLDRAATIDIVAIDKTGTLTVGRPSLTDVVTRAGAGKFVDLPEDSRPWLEFAAGLERRSEHPLAHAIVVAAEGAGIAVPDATDFHSTSGKGAEATVNGCRVVAGSERMFRERGAEGFEHFFGLALKLQDEGKTCVWFGEQVDGKLEVRAVFGLADTVRDGALDLVRDLKALGVKRVVMLTGDQQRVADAIGRATGVDEVRAELLPEDKLMVIRQLKKEGKVMMAGDGVNDAPALAAADLGVAMGAAGTDVAMETADVVLMGDRVENLSVLLGHARRARKVLLQNLIFAGGVILVLVLAALGFSLALPVGVVGHEGSTVLVCLNGLRLLALRPLNRTIAK